MSAQPAAIAQPLGDEELVRRVRAGDPAATEQLIRRHNRQLYRTARAILRDDAEAEDAVQEAYIQAIGALDRFRGESSLSTWLVRIAANEALMRRRRLSRAATVVSVDADAEALLEAMPDDAPGPEGEAMNAETREMLERRIDELPDLYRPVFVMRAVQEMSVEETAVALDLPEATVRTRFFRARALLRTALEHNVDRSLTEVFAFDGERCDRIVARVMGALGR